MPMGRPLASASARTRSSALCGWSEPVGSCSRTRTAPSSGSIRARSISVSTSPVGPGLYTSPASEREAERRRHARLQRADALPRALHAALDRPLEAAAAGDLEVREPGAVQDLREPELVGRRDLSRERLLAEEADRRVGEGRHVETLPPLRLLVPR